MLRIDISGLGPGVHEMQLEPNAEELELDPGKFSEIRVDLRLDRKPDRVFVSFSADAVALLQCDRTLVDFDQRIAGSYALLFAPEEMADGAKDDEDVRALRPEDEEIDVTDAVRDTLLLAVPQRKVAPGAEDVDIPTRFGVPADGGEIDPRWEALKALKDDSAHSDSDA